MCKGGHADHIYVCTCTPCTFVQFSPMHQETALFNRGAATLLREGLEEGGMHTDWATDWVQGSHSYRDILGTHDMHTQWRKCPPSSPPPQLPLSSSSSSFATLALFELWGSLVSGSAGLLLEVSAGAKW